MSSFYDSLRKVVDRCDDDLRKMSEASGSTIKSGRLTELARRIERSLNFAVEASLVTADQNLGDAIKDILPVNDRRYLSFSIGELAKIIKNYPPAVKTAGVSRFANDLCSNRSALWDYIRYRNAATHTGSFKDGRTYEDHPNEEQIPQGLLERIKRLFVEAMNDAK